MGSNARELLIIFGRAFGIVTCTALNVSQIAHAHYASAFFTGSTLSFFWWMNTKTAAKSDIKGAQICYALGAGCGTVTGMLLGSWLNG